MSPSKKFLSLVTLLLLGPLLAAGTANQKEIVDLESRLSRIQEQIVQLKIKIGAQEKRESTILSSLDKLSLGKRLIQKELALSRLQMEKTGQELAALKKKIAEQEALLESQRRAIEKTLVSIYKFGKFNFIQFVFQAQDIRVLSAESKRLSQLAGYQESIIADFQRSLDELGRSRQALEKKNTELARLVAENSQKKRELESQEKENRVLIQRIQRDKKTYEQAVEELTERAEQLQLLMKKLEREEIVFPFPFVPLYEKKEKLPWPVEGKVTTFFGLERHPAFKTVTMNNGIEIAPLKNDTTVRSVHAGKVAYADYFQGYGNLIIIDHGMTYYSLYGHCAEFLVNKGDWITAGQPIALAGDSGSLAGLSLYFEIRFKTKPLNPLQWLSRR
jgi:septal ring factor EnvC (AmiA/AmiB activator)